MKPYRDKIGEQKVYCQNCRFISQINNCTLGVPKVGKPQHMVCFSPKNLISKSHDTWFQNVKDVKHKQNPCEINKNNDCKWYEAIPQVCIGVRSL